MTAASSTSDEFDRLQRIAAVSRYSAGVNEAMVRHSFRVARRWLRPGSDVLEIGPAEGHMTDLLVQDGHRLTVVEGSAQFCAQIAGRHREANVVNALVEDYRPDQRFDHILLGHVLEHVGDPVAVLARLRGWLKDDRSTIFAAVPNARSIHRQAAVIMGLLAHEAELNEADVHHGHRRVFDPESFRACFRQAGLTVEFFGGYWLKPLANSQIESHWTDAMLDAFVELGERYPDIAAEIYVVARR